jgi:hypothetical protein
MKKVALVSGFVFLITLISGSLLLAQPKIPDNISPFTSLRVSAGVKVFLTQGSEIKLDVEGSESDVEDLVIENKGSTLHIYYESMKFWEFKDRNAKVYLTAVTLESIDISSGAEILGQNAIKSKALEIDASSGSQITLQVITESLSLEASSGSDVNISGSTNAVSTESSSGSDIDAEGLTAKKGVLRSSSGASTRVTLTSEVDAKASSGASITVYGNPSVRNTDSSSGGSVRIK